MTDLEAFLNARLGEVEATAKCALMWKEQHRAAIFIARYTSEWGAIDDYDPARMLREVAAKRRILARHLQISACPSFPCADLLDMASAWSDHPDFDAEWAAVPFT